MQQTTRLAVLDLGSNSVRMEIYEIDADGNYQSLRQEKRLVRLSERMGQENRLQEEPKRRTLEALKEFRAILEVLAVDEVRAMATEAVRRAGNGEEFLAAVKRETGFSFRVLSGQEEAAYDCRSIDFSLGMKNYIMLDTGGGSAEIALVRNGIMEQAVSLPLGSVVLSEKWALQGRISAVQCFDVIQDIGQSLQRVSWLLQGKGMPLVLLGGSNRILGRLHMRRYCPECKSLQGYTMTSEQMMQLFRVLLASDAEQRLAMPGMEVERVNLVLGGAMPLVVLMLYLESVQMTFSLEGLRTGVFQEYYREQGLIK